MWLSQELNRSFFWLGNNMHPSIENLYHELYDWLVKPNSCVPDVEIGAVLDWISAKENGQSKNKISQEAVNELALLRNAICNPNSFVPDVEIGSIIDWMRDRISIHLSIKEDLDKLIISELFFHDMPKKHLIGTVLWGDAQYFDNSESDIEAYIDLLVESGKITNNNDMISFKK